MDIRIPTLIVWGTLDRMIPAWHTTTAHEVIEDSRVVLFEGAGHFPHLDEPGRFAKLLGDFIRRQANISSWSDYATGQCHPRPRGCRSRPAHAR